MSDKTKTIALALLLVLSCVLLWFANSLSSQVSIGG